MKKMLKGFFILVLVVIAVLVLIITLFFGWNSYTSPVREAGREYNRTVRSYRNDEIESMNDVYERLAFLEKHYNSPTHSKMQGGEKTKVIPKDMITLFGEPDAVYNDVDKGYGKTNIYQYKYGAETLNLHEDWDGVNEFILEDYSGEVYQPNEMDNFFFEAIKYHQSNFERVDDDFELIPETDIPSFTADNEPTRTIRQGGWYTWSQLHEHYFDDGQAEMSPEEFVLLRIVEDDEENHVLDWMYRRYRDAYVEITDQEEVDEKISSWNEWNMYFEKIKDEELSDIVTVQDLADDYGDITRLNYNFRTGVLEVNWLVMGGNQMPLEINANIPMSANNVPTQKEDIYALQVDSVGSDRLFSDASILRTEDFIGQ